VAGIKQALRYLKGLIGSGITCYKHRNYTKGRHSFMDPMPVTPITLMGNVKLATLVDFLVKRAQPPSLGNRPSFATAQRMQKFIGQAKLVGKSCTRSNGYIPQASSRCLSFLKWTIKLRLSTHHQHGVFLNAPSISLSQCFHSNFGGC
jgi:hypothetical protein